MGNKSTSKIFLLSAFVLGVCIAGSLSVVNGSASYLVMDKHIENEYGYYLDITSSKNVTATIRTTLEGYGNYSIGDIYTYDGTNYTITQKNSSIDKTHYLVDVVIADRPEVIEDERLYNAVSAGETIIHFSYSDWVTNSVMGFHNGWAWQNETVIYDDVTTQHYVDPYYYQS